MEADEARRVFQVYYSDEDFRHRCRKRGFDNSGTDTIKEHEFRASLLRQKLPECKDDKEKRRLLEAANYFKSLYQKEFNNH
ncbi:MAG: hypothetical protein II838_03895 [Lachnospiraceae bacterium]|nr:hypothetical protein [Lachnospiraceae bacterium]